MGFPIYRYTSKQCPPYLYSGIIYNSVLFLCIVLTMVSLLVIFTVMDWIIKIYGYMKI